MAHGTGASAPGDLSEEKAEGIPAFAARVAGLLVELSGENPPMAAAEVEGALAALGVGRVAERDDLVLVVDAPSEAARPLAARLGLAHAVDAHWFSTAAAARAIVPPFSGIDLGGATFAVRARRVREHHPDLPLSDLERAIGALLAEKGKVDLRDPEVEVRLVVAEWAHAGALVAEIDRSAYERRAVKHRPFFSPVSLHPRFARALVNLARVKPGDRVLDPFAGTGGTALEAGLVGAKVYAGDIDARMVAGTKRTLEAYGVPGAVVEERDVGEAPEFAPGVDAVVTDPPYGRSATLAQEATRDLYTRFFVAAAEALRPGGRLVAGLHDEDLVALGGEILELEAVFPHRVHASLTRRFAVYVKR